MTWHCRMKGQVVDAGWTFPRFVLGPLGQIAKSQRPPAHAMQAIIFPLICNEKSQVRVAVEKVSKIGPKKTETA